MNPSQFDTIARFFAARKLTRRQALGAAGGTLAAAGLAPVAALDATPAPATPAPTDSGKVPFMFVQTLGAGSLTPKAGEAGVLTLEADHLAGQTLFFSDRPERIVGMVPTERFLAPGEEGLGFEISDPPNAALVFAETREQDQPTEVMIVELIDPTYDATTGKVTYDVRLLQDDEAVDFTLVTERLTAADSEHSFEAASLFIDDCPNGHIVCWLNDQPIGRIPTDGSDFGFCWDSDDWCCLPCASPPSGDTWDDGCNYTFPDQCGGQCGHSYAAGFSCSN
jgi:hypothetical protein